MNRVESWKEGLNEYYFLTCREQRIAIEQEITSIKDRYTWTFYFLANGVATKRRIEMSRENNIFTGVLDRNTKIKVYTRSFNMDLFYTLKPYKFEFISRNIVK